MDPILQSAKYGEIFPMEDTPVPVYCGELKGDGVETLDFSVHCSMPRGRKTEEYLREAEARIAWLLTNEPALRPKIAERAVRTLLGTWTSAGNDVPTAEDFGKGLKISSFNCFSDGAYECWYTTPEPVDNFDLVAEFDQSLEMRDVHFDG